MQPQLEKIARESAGFVGQPVRLARIVFPGHTSILRSGSVFWTRGRSCCSTGL